MVVLSGYCHCGCGQKTRMYDSSCKSRGQVKGEYRKYYKKHHLLKNTLDSTGYVTIRMPGHPRVDSHGYVKEHILIIEKAYGINVTSEMEIHHKNENRADNRLENLVLCANVAEHRLLHQKLRALKSCGNENYRKCPFCKKYDNPSNMNEQKHKEYESTYFHSSCRNEHLKRLRMLA
jgi:metal-responsive CopG/Arc/MetJ family transcriptional regulator